MGTHDRTVLEEARALSGARLPTPVERRYVTSDSVPPKTFISDLRPGRYATLEAEVVRLEPIRAIESRQGGSQRVRNGVLKDGTGEIALVLWGDEVELVSEHDRVRLVDAWVKDYRGKPEISLGRRGRVEKVRDGSP
jgi:replication factor A1